MPGMSGLELAHGVLSTNPETLVLFISGFSNHSLKDNPLLESGKAEFVQKPVSPNKLAAKAKALLEARKSKFLRSNTWKSESGHVPERKFHVPERKKQGVAMCLIVKNRFPHVPERKTASTSLPTSPASHSIKAVC
jgi:DNA-binding response OmpR family regulator